MKDNHESARSQVISSLGRQRLRAAEAAAVLAILVASGLAYVALEEWFGVSGETMEWLGDVVIPTATVGLIFATLYWMRARRAKRMRSTETK